MTARILNGKLVAEQIRATAAEGAQKLAEAGRSVKLVSVMVGDNPASDIYIRQQRRQFAEANIDYELLELPEQTTQEQLLNRLQRLSVDASVTGILLQMPLPERIDERKAQAAIAVEKDVEAVNPVNVGRLFCDQAIVAGPCTPMAAVELISRACGDLAGKETVIVGHSELIGKPIAMLLLRSKTASPTVTICHVATRDLAYHTRRAEVLVVATGVAQARWLRYKRQLDTRGPTEPPELSPLIGREMIRPGAVLIDVAINRIPRGFDRSGRPLRNEQDKIAMKTVGDVDFDAAVEIAEAVTPVPGGVGPVTVAMLLKNTVACARALL
jgi:methylenetetrahydrofolate dehydrogenase (NADP+)/methenyltetrahydrofolate cyclohydrolase